MSSHEQSGIVAQSTERTPPDSAPEPDLFCPACGYDLRRIDHAERCPECGLEVDRARRRSARIPWEHRRRIGRVRAYWRMVLMATFRTARLAQEVERPVSYADAQRFRLVTTLLAALPPAALLVGLMIWHKGTAFLSTLEINFATEIGPEIDLIGPWEAGVAWPPVLPIGILLGMLGVTGVASYWFHPSELPVERQNRAVALSHYACAPLAFMPILFLLTTALVVMAGSDADDLRIGGINVGLLVALAHFAVGVFLLIMLWLATLTLLKHAAAASTKRLALAAFLIPMSWALCLALGLLAFPWFLGFFRLVVGSLR